MTDSNPPNESKPGLRQKLLSQSKEASGMFFYLWVLFALFTYHKAIVLAQHGIPYEPFGVAFIKAFILVKLMLLAEHLNLMRLRNRPLVYPILQKSLTLAIIFILFNFVEEITVGLWKGKTIAESVPKFGGGSPAEYVVVGLILAVALIPFFAFRELSLAIGKGVIGGLLLKGSPESGSVAKG